MYFVWAYIKVALSVFSSSITCIPSDVHCFSFIAILNRKEGKSSKVSLWYVILNGLVKVPILSCKQTSTL